MITVITKTQFKPSRISEMEDLTDRSLVVFKRQPGFVSMEVKKDLNDGGTLTIFKWETKEDHERCMTSPDWGSLTQEWEDFVAQEDCSFEIVFLGNDWKSA